MNAAVERLKAFWSKWVLEHLLAFWNKLCSLIRTESEMWYFLKAHAWTQDFFGTVQALYELFNVVYCSCLKFSEALCFSARCTCRLWFSADTLKSLSTFMELSFQSVLLHSLICESEGNEAQRFLQTHTAAHRNTLRFSIDSPLLKLREILLLLSPICESERSEAQRFLQTHTDAHRNTFSFFTDCPRFSHPQREQALQTHSSL